MTAHLNYCRQMVKQAQEIIADPARPLIHAEWRRLAGLASASTKFLLPPGGRIIGGCELRGLDADDELRLPFPCIALEFEALMDRPLRANEVSCPKRLVFAREEGDVIRVTVVPFVAGGLWVAYPDVFLPRKGWLHPDRDARGRIQFHSFDSTRSQGVPREDYQDELTAVLDFLSALACSNVEIAKSHAGSVKKAMRKALPFDDYHVLMVRTRATGTADASGCASARSPREHVRRGHIRRYESGLRVWVNATVVNPGIGGKVSKDYRVTA